MTVVADTPHGAPARAVGHALRELAAAVRRRGRRGATRVSAQDALVRALCHDMRSPLASLEALLRHLDEPVGEDASRHAELVDLARAQTEHLSSMLRTAVATGGAVEGRAGLRRRMGDVLAAATAAAGLPSSQLTTEFGAGAADVEVADARVQRILTNLLENAHRHGEDAPVRLVLTRLPGWVRICLSQPGVPDRVAGHLSTDAPPQDLTGLGLWSVRRQTAELGGELSWHRPPGGDFTFCVCLPDR
ncbi:sensor histidine kinase [Goekera deserti]|uniref:histidine kinase n=1 Tax=Goekera deserti TaxID=2497753 RepID=A0A7K3WAW4_9ACTN|nr:HAMP domain-containing sensor histidine kinase [Goekera deserti]NDI49658.1 sensor histidine kinase [Goekera deserti]NEL53149.1 HAMP domain-containing histidine kinase [Goekera deserti]